MYILLYKKYISCWKGSFFHKSGGDRFPKKCIKKFAWESYFQYKKSWIFWTISLKIMYGFHGMSFRGNKRYISLYYKIDTIPPNTCK